MRSTLWSMVVVVVAAGCGPSEVLIGDPLATELDEATEASQDVTCAPRVTVYPVRGKHNHGYDSKAGTKSLWSCNADRSNSDFVKGDHIGNDIWAAEGTPVAATADGTLTLTGWSDYSGNKVTIKDACGWYHFFCHLKSIAPGMKNGVKVKAGQIIGYVGKTGTASNGVVHLHTSIYPAGSYSKGVDPHPYQRKFESNVCGPATKPVPCDTTVGPFSWSCNGPVTGKACVNVNEPGDPDAWKDNHLCSARNLGIRFSYAGPIAGMRCTQLAEGSETAAWKDNYLCVPPFSPFVFSWSMKGPIAGKTCLPVTEPSEASYWNDNDLCWSLPEQRVQRRSGFAFSSYGPVAGMSCVSVNEPGDPDSWSDNYFCSATDIGLKWSYAGPIAGMRCTQVTEGSEGTAWSDNYLCVPETEPTQFTWTSRTPSDNAARCVAWYESSDPNTWDDNYLCW